MATTYLADADNRRYVQTIDLPPRIKVILCACETYWQQLEAQRRFVSSGMAALELRSGGA